MKRKLAFLSVALVTFAVVTALALPNVEIGPTFYDGAKVLPQVDTATTTTAPSQYLPRHIGDILIGKVLTTNALWVGYAKTTNSWGIVVTNGGPWTADQIYSGNIASARITNALNTAAASLGAGIPGANITGNIALGRMTNALSPTLYSGTYTNDIAGVVTNVIVVLNGVTVSVTKTP